MHWRFSDQNQQARAIQAFLSRAGDVFSNGAYINGEELTERFWSLLDNQGQLSHGEHILLNVALDLWNGRGEVRLAELFDLDAHNRALVVSLIQAMDNPRAIEAWLQNGNSSSAKS